MKRTTSVLTLEIFKRDLEIRLAMVKCLEEGKIQLLKIEQIKKAVY